MPSREELLDCAISAAKAAGAHAAGNIDRRKETEAVFAHDVKLRLDLECQQVAETTISNRFPAHAILGEESKTPPPASHNYLWVVDPIDGTVNFTHGIRHWCCSVAVMQESRTVAGAVYAPLLDELYTATDKSRATLNGNEIRVSETAMLGDALVLTGISKSVDAGLEQFGFFREIALNSRKTRIMGSAALDLCRVAAGAADAYYESTIYLWDIAAAGLIVERAGGRTKTAEAPPEPNRLRFLASNGRLHDELVELVWRG